LIRAQRVGVARSFGQTTTFAGPVSSSIVRNITPFADPGI
jgi:hypothetical protein